MEELKAKLDKLYLDIKDVVDLTVEIRRRSPQDKKQTALVWQSFLGSFFKYIKQKSKEEKDNLLSGISFAEFFK